MARNGLLIAAFAAVGLLAVVWLQGGAPSADGTLSAASSETASEDSGRRQITVRDGAGVDPDVADTGEGPGAARSAGARGESELASTGRGGDDDASERKDGVASSLPAGGLAPTIAQELDDLERMREESGIDINTGEPFVDLLMWRRVQTDPDRFQSPACLGALESYAREVFASVSVVDQSATLETGLVPFSANQAVRAFMIRPVIASGC